MSVVQCCDSHELSIVVQGPCVRAHETHTLSSIEETLTSIRQTFPYAQIILSTWEGSNVDGLAADDIALSADPGPIIHPFLGACNINRMLTSTAKGLALAVRPFCIKTRTDVLFRSDALARHELRQSSNQFSLERRIWITSTGTFRLESWFRPFQAADLVQYGLTADLRKLWAVPPSFTYNEVFSPDLSDRMLLMSPEQALLTGYLHSVGITINLFSTIDGRRDVLYSSLDSMTGIFDVFNENEEGVVLPIRISSANLYIPAENAGSFRSLRHEFVKDPEATCNRVFTAFRQNLRELASAPAGSTYMDLEKRRELSRRSVPSPA